MPKGLDAPVAPIFFSGLFPDSDIYSLKHLSEAFGRIGTSEELTKLHCLRDGSNKRHRYDYGDSGNYFGNDLRERTTACQIVNPPSVTSANPPAAKRVHRSRFLVPHLDRHREAVKSGSEALMHQS